jgi:hypothetical protein
MAIYKLISNGSFGPDEIKIMTQAYERALIDLGIVNREDPITEFDRKIYCERDRHRRTRSHHSEGPRCQRTWTLQD